jgi:ribosome-associated toxin RatA of RatAB toxin-antitoxin module
MRRAFLEAACKWFLAAAALFAVQPALPREAAPPEPRGGFQFRATRDGEVVSVSAAAELPVDAAVAWSVLTDYESYPRFISGMSRSAVIARNAEGVVLEQKSELGALFFVQRVEVRLAVVEAPPRSIASRAIDGSFRDLTGRYELEPVPGGVRVSYSGRWVPAFYLPPLVGMAVVRHSLEKHFSEMMAEIQRRGAGGTSRARGAPAVQTK